MFKMTPVTPSSTILIVICLSILSGHMMTRTAQSCMIVSSICILATLVLGTASLVIKHAILSMIASTACAASGVYLSTLQLVKCFCSVCTIRMSLYRLVLTCHYKVSNLAAIVASFVFSECCAVFYANM